MQANVSKLGPETHGAKGDSRPPGHACAVPAPAATAALPAGKKAAVALALSATLTAAGAFLWFDPFAGEVPVDLRSGKGSRLAQGPPERSPPMVAAAGETEPQQTAVPPAVARETAVQRLELVRGVVLESGTGRAVAGAVLAPYAWREGKERTWESTEAVTDEGGYFHWEVPDVLETFLVTAEGCSPAVCHVVFAGDADAGDTIVELERVLRIGGTVVHEDGAPLGVVRIDVVSAHIEGSGRRDVRSGAWEHLGVTSAEDGSFALIPPVMGQYRLALRKPGVGGRIVSGVLPGTEGLVLRVPAGAAVAGSVLGEDGEPAAGRTVHWRVCFNFPVPWRGSALSDGDGGFLIEGLPAPAVYRIALDTTSRIVPWLSRRGGDDGSVRVRVGPGERIDDVVLDHRGLFADESAQTARAKRVAMSGTGAARGRSGYRAVRVRYLFLNGKTPPCLVAADADDDEEVTITDAISRLRPLSSLRRGAVTPALAITS